MSRVGKYPVEIPQGVQVAIAGGMLTAKGRLGELKLPLTDHIEAVVEGNHVSVKPRTAERQARMMWGTTRALIASMVKGLKMPRVDGMQFYRAIATTSPALTRRVIFVTGDVTGTDAERFLEEAGCRWLAKPFRLGDLLRVAREVIA